MEFSINNFKRSIFFTVLILYLSMKMFPFFQNFSTDFLDILVVGLLVGIALTNSYTINESILVIASLLVCSIIYLYSHEINLLVIEIIILSAISMDKKKIIQVYILVYILFFIYMIITNLMGLYSTEFVYKYVGGVSEVVATYGFGHPNQISSRYVVFVCLCLYYALKYTKSNIWKMLVIFTLLEIWIFNISLSKTGIIFFIFIYIVMIFLTKKVHIKEFTKMLVYIYTFFLIVLVFLYSFYEKNINFINNIDNILTGRIRLSAKFFDLYPLNLFGHNLDFSGYDNVLDSSIAYIFIVYGLIGFLLYLFIYSKTFKFLFQTKLYLEIVFMIFFLIMGIVELVQLNMSFNFSFIFITYLFQSNEFKAEECIE